MNLRLDPWAPERGPSALDDLGNYPDRPARLDLRVELEAWAPVQPGLAPSPGFDRVRLLDGTRRVEARVTEHWAQDGVLRSAPGLLGAVAVGVAEVDARGPEPACRVTRAEVRRVLVLGNGRRGEALDITPGPGQLGALRYEPAPGRRGGDEGELANRLQSAMQALEAEVTEDVSGEGGVTIKDGRLPPMELPRTLGYIKTLHDLVLAPDEQRLLLALRPGQRTPIFSVAGQRDRHAWFLRLSDSPAWHQGLAGVVRLETHVSEGLGFAVAAADWGCRHLPRLASRPWADPRAPQQLAPVAALERELARRLGDPGLVRRRIAAHLQRSAGA